MFLLAPWFQIMGSVYKYMPGVYKVLAQIGWNLTTYRFHCDRESYLPHVSDAYRATRTMN